MRRLRKLGGSAKGAPELESLVRQTPDNVAENVVDLASFRRERLHAQRRTIFYVTTNGRWRAPIDSFPFLEVIEIRSGEALASAVMCHTPDLILLEGDVSWLDPIRFIAEAHAAFEIPIVMIQEESQSEGSARLKQAYAAGLYDVLFAPLKREDLVEMLEALLTLQLQSSLHH